jgi:hypothetical protein
MCILVMPAWIAGIQVRQDASGNILVDLDSSSCWNDVLETASETRQGHSAPIFKVGTKKAYVAFTMTR